MTNKNIAANAIHEASAKVVILPVLHAGDKVLLRLHQSESCVSLASLQKESFLEQVKSLKKQASRAEIMRDRERITRKVSAPVVNLARV